MSLARYRMQGQPQQKIRPEHMDRAAVVYVRQSSRQQVLEHTESTRLQYALAERAVALGWARSQVTVIDDDLGVSAATAVGESYIWSGGSVTTARAMAARRRMPPESSLGNFSSVPPSSTNSRVRFTLGRTSALGLDLR